jgi:hypothetical protein
MEINFLIGMTLDQASFAGYLILPALVCAGTWDIVHMSVSKKRTAFLDAPFWTGS